MYKQYKQLSGDTIDGLQDWLVQLDHVVKNTIIFTSWTEDELTRIQSKRSSSLAPVKNLLRKVTGKPSSATLLEVDVKKTFLEMTDQVSERVVSALLQAQRVRGGLIEIKATMEAFAMIYLKDGKTLDTRRMNERSYWRWILRSHRDKMTDFDKTVSMCAKFYNITSTTVDRNRMVEVKLGSIKSELKAFQDKLSMSRLWLEKDLPLEPFIRMLSDSVKSLEISDMAATKQKVEVMRRIDEAIRQR
jgi:hypothetical protein